MKKKMVLGVCRLSGAFSLPGLPVKVRGTRGKRVKILHGRDHSATCLLGRVLLCAQ